MSNHTPSPWHAVQIGSELYVHGADSSLVCDMHRNGPTNEAAVYQCDANARLIAAAPTMYNYLTELAEGGDDKARAIISSIARS